MGKEGTKRRLRSLLERANEYEVLFKAIHFEDEIRHKCYNLKGTYMYLYIHTSAYTHIHAKYFIR